MVVDAVSSRGSFLYLFKILPNNLFDFLFLLKKYERYGVKTKHIKHALYKTLFESIEEPPPSIARGASKTIIPRGTTTPFSSSSSSSSHKSSAFWRRFCDVVRVGVKAVVRVLIVN